MAKMHMEMVDLNLSHLFDLKFKNEYGVSDSVNSFEEALKNSSAFELGFLRQSEKSYLSIDACFN